MAKRKEVSVTEQLNRLEEMKQRTFRNLIKSTLKDNEEFAQANDAYRKLKRYRTEAENLLSDEGMEKQRERLNQRIAKIQAQIDELDTKREVAEDSIEDINAAIEMHENAHATIGGALVKHLNGGEVPTDADEYSSIVEDVLGSVDMSALTEVSDPFADFRAANRKNDTEDSDED